MNIWVILIALPPKPGREAVQLYAFEDEIDARTKLKAVIEETAAVQITGYPSMNELKKIWMEVSQQKPKQAGIAVIDCVELQTKVMTLPVGDKHSPFAKETRWRPVMGTAFSGDGRRMILIDGANIQVWKEDES